MTRLDLMARRLIPRLGELFARMGKKELSVRTGGMYAFLPFTVSISG